MNSDAPFLAGDWVLLHRAHTTLGDNLMISALARTLSRKFAVRVAVQSPLPELFYNNPDVPFVISGNGREICFKKYESREAVYTVQCILRSYRVLKLLTRTFFRKKKILA